MADRVYELISRGKVKTKCEYCGKEITHYLSILKNTKRSFCDRKCRDDSIRGENNPAKRQEVREKISLKAIGNMSGSYPRIPMTKEHCLNISKAKIGKPNLKLRGTRHTEESRKNMSEGQKRLYKNGYVNPATGRKRPDLAIYSKLHPPRGRLNGMFGKPSPHGKRGTYKGITFRSSWEIIYAKWLDLKNYCWEYEPKIFYYEEFTYTPDFWVNELNSYVEIKGFLYRHGDRDITKINRFKQENPLLLITDIASYKLEVEKWETATN